MSLPANLPFDDDFTDGLILGLTGYPLTHSLSPRLHNAALAALGISGVYQLFPLPDGENPLAGLTGLLARLRTRQLQGLNVTIPYKQAVIPLLDDLTAAAKAVQAVNTIYLRGDRLVGDNTDAAGFWCDLRTSLPLVEQAGQQALVLGAGGSARAVCYALLKQGWQVTLAARRLEQTQALAAWFRPFFGRKAIRGCHFFQVEQIQAAALLVNTTPVGMFPNSDCSPWPDGLALPAGAAVYDLVYNPRQTLLVQQAAAAGLAAVSGLGMLVEQAALALECWLARPAPRDVMRAAAGMSTA